MLKGMGVRKEELTLSVQGVSVGVVQVLGGRQGADEVVPVSAVVGGTLDLGQVGSLVEDGGLLVLGVAGGAGGGEAGEEERAVDHQRAGGLRVGEHAAAAGTEHVGAIVARDARGGAAALGHNAAEDGGDLAASGGRGRLEVLLELGGRAGGGGRLRAGGERAAVGDGVAGGGAARAGAVGLDDGALDLLVELVVHALGLGTVDLGGDGVAHEGDDAGDLGRVGLGDGEGSLGEEVEGTTAAQVVALGSVELDLNGLAGANALESLLGETLSGDLVADAIENNLAV